jgi:hypothetical protein
MGGSLAKESLGLVTCITQILAIITFDTRPIDVFQRQVELILVMLNCPSSFALDRRQSSRRRQETAGGTADEVIAWTRFTMIDSTSRRAIASYPLIVRRAVLKLENPSPGLTLRLMNRWSCSTRLLRIAASPA